MNRSGFTARTPAAAVLAAAAASGLVLAGCGNNSGATTAATSSQPAAAGSGLGRQHIGFRIVRLPCRRGAAPSPSSR